MAKISLRSYTQDIERMVESGRTEEAIAHCRNILQTYSKCVDVYRLLGKAYLESQRFGDAADIFQRVLSSIPEDFVSHVGMSMIREDEGNLDEAIWHMERAFEIQPSNGAIQDELRRLYGKRDGMEPPKIRLTRGALARMYFRGELYPQAIAELRAALHEDATRLDLQLLLASVHFKAGQRVDAAEKASTLLSKLPNCLEANFILAQVLKGTEQDEEAKTYLQQLVSLDPYFAYISEQYSSPELVPDQAVTLERITWKPGQTPAGTGGQPAWAASLGIDIGGASKGGEALPDWLAGVQETERNAPDSRALPALTPEGPKEQAPLPSFPGEMSSQEPAPAGEADELPDWMKSAGWAPSTGEGEKAEASFQFQESPPARPTGDEPVVQADIPDWLQAMAPAEQVEQAEQNLAEEAQEDVLPWLDALLPPKPEGGAPAIGQQSEPAPASEIPADLEAELPDWLKDNAPSGSPAAAIEEVPDWLSGLGETSTAEPVPPTASSPAEAFGLAEPPDELPDWLLQGESQPTVRTGISRPEPATPDGETPSWLSEMGEETPPSAEPMPEKAAEAPLDEELPDWLLDTAKEPPVAESLPDWMSEKTVKAPSIEKPALEAAPSEEIPDWLREEVGETPATAEPAAEIAEVAPAEEIPDWLMGELEEETPPAGETFAEVTGATAAEEIPAWLAGEVEEKGPLAEKALAEIEEAALAEELPDWLLETTEKAPAVEEPIAETAPVEEIPDWLLSEGEAPAVEETLAEATPAEELPDWLTGEIEEIPAVEEPVAENLEAAPAEELPAWLLGETKETPAIEEPFAEVAEAVPAEEIPEWLSGMAEETPAAEEPVAEIPEAAPAEELPAWLLGETKETPAAEEPAAEVAEAVPAEEIPDWLSGMAEETPAVEEPVAENLEAAPAEELPAWLLGETEEAPAAEEPAAEVAEAVPAEEIPEWLSGMAEETPTAEEPVAEIPEAAPAEELPAWLLGETEETPAIEEPFAEVAEAVPAEEIPEWLMPEGEKEIPVAEVTEVAEAAPAEELPDWLVGKFEEAPAAEEPAAEIPEAAPAEELPDWLLEAADKAPVIEEPSAEIPEAAPAEEIPDWLTGVVEETPAAEEPVAEIPEAAPTEELPGWLLEEEAPAIEEPAAEAIEAAPAEEIPGWLLEAAEKAPAIEEPVAEIPEATPTEEIPAWLLSEEEVPAAEEPISEIIEAAPAAELPGWLTGEIEEAPAAEEPVAETPEAAPAEELPAWLAGEFKEEALAIEEEAAEITEAAPVEEITPVAPDQEVTSAPSAEMDADAAFAWLESLAVKQGAEEALLLTPEERTEQPPEWVVQEAAQSGQPEVPAEEPVEEIIEAAPAEEIPAWLLEPVGEEALSAEELLAEIEPGVESAAPAEEIPEWLFETPAEAALTEEPEAAPTGPEAGEALPAEEIPAWLLEQAGTFEQLEEPLAELEEEEAGLTPIEAQPTQDIPAWLLGNIEPAVTPETIEQPALAEQPEMEIPAASEEIQAETAAPDWLEKLEAEAPVDPLADTRPTPRRPQAPEAIETEPLLEIPAIEPEVVEPPQEEPPAEAPVAEMDADAAFAWLESLAVKQGAEEALLLKPEERTDTPPDWVLEETARAGETVAPVEPAAVAAPSVEAELPPVEEAPAEAEEPHQAPEEVPAVSTAEMDADAAFAWLESLAVRQGAEEALLLKPEERSETPPDWIYAAQAEEKPALPVAEIEPEPAPTAEEAEVPVVAELQTIAEDQALAKDQALAIEPALEEGPAHAEVPPLAEELVIEEALPPAAGEEVPELPSWLSEGTAETEELEWTPPPVTAAPLVELNNASLIELERLPGVGFIMAQNILDYRESRGHFHKIEDLLAVPGMSQDTLELIRERIMVIEPEPPPPPPPVEKPVLKTVILSTDTQGAPADLAAAREAFNQGNIEQALASYTSLIRTDQSLDDVIADLREATYHYADNVQIWQHLGDAYLRANRTREAMEAYISAEKLLR